jgi:hypothetical protein
VGKFQWVYIGQIIVSTNIYSANIKSIECDGPKSYEVRYALIAINYVKYIIASIHWTRSGPCTTPRVSSSSSSSSATGIVYGSGGSGSGSSGCYGCTGLI